MGVRAPWEDGTDGVATVPLAGPKEGASRAGTGAVQEASARMRTGSRQKGFIVTPKKVVATLYATPCCQATVSGQPPIGILARLNAAFRAALLAGDRPLKNRGVT
jgi:hypothetical protein